MIEHVVTVTYDHKLIRRAVGSFEHHRLGFRLETGICALMLGSSICSVLLPPDLLGYCILFNICITVVMLYLVFVRISAECQGLLPLQFQDFFTKRNDQTVVFTFSDHGIKAELPETISEFEWPLFNKVVKLKDVWLLVYAKSRYIMLPTSNLTPECMRFIEEKIVEVKRKDAV